MRDDVQTVRDQLSHLGPMRAGAGLEAFNRLVAQAEEVADAAANVFGYIEPRFKVGGVDEGPSVKRLAEALARWEEL